MSQKLREATIKDLPELLSLLHQLSPLKEGETENPEQLKETLEKIIQDKHNFIYVFEENGKLAGTATLLVQLNLSHGGNSIGHIENVVVEEQQRGTGVGKKLVDFLLERAKQKGCYKVSLACKKKNIPFYAKSGILESGEVQLRLDF